MILPVQVAETPETLMHAYYLWECYKVISYELLLSSCPRRFAAKLMIKCLNGTQAHNCYLCVCICIPFKQLGEAPLHAPHSIESLCVCMHVCVGVSWREVVEINIIDNDTHAHYTLSHKYICTKRNSCYSAGWTITTITDSGHNFCRSFWLASQRITDSHQLY